MEIQKTKEQRVFDMADTFFVSQLGTSASGATGIVFALMALVTVPVVVRFFRGLPEE
ncbi:MAG: hypothetical protein LUD07_05050 [Clostridiales bacterium]|nr:hypothetical protein [Clostridiales bacterium]